jgi:hypothetical protein
LFHGPLKVYFSIELYHGETWELMVRRWAKLEKDFLSKTGVFDISKIPDIYDCIKYDLLHNISILQLEQAEEIYTYAKNLADVVIPQVIINGPLIKYITEGRELGGSPWGYARAQEEGYKDLPRGSKVVKIM